MKGIRFLTAMSLLVMSTMTFATGNLPGGAKWIYGDDFGSPAYSGVEMIDTFSLMAPYPQMSGDTIGKLKEEGYTTNEAIMGFFEWKYQGSKGVAGAKLVTEDRSADAFWDFTPYDSLVIVYQGPSAGHKVLVAIGEGVSETDQPFVEKLGTLNANPVEVYSDAEWKTVALPIPKTVVAGSIRDFVREVRFVIVANGNVSTAPISGVFRLDLLGLKKVGGVAVHYSNKSQSLVNNNKFFTPLVNGTVSVSLFDVNGGLVYNKSMNVAAGQRYTMNQVVKAPVSGMYLAKIYGAGIKMNKKMWFNGK